MPTYPAQIDTTQSLPTAIDNFTPVQGAIFNRLRDAVIAIETALGANPAASYGTLVARLGVFESTLGNLQLIELDNDLGGTLENPLVIGLQGRPLSSAIPHPGNILQWNGIAWVPSDALGHNFFFAGGDLAGDGYTQRVIGLQSFPLSPTSPLSGQVLQWNGTNWLPSTISLATTLIYQPGGVASGNIYTSWTALMTARALIEGPSTIVIDDSIVSPALIDTGIWDLTHNTSIIGYKGNQNTPNQGVGSTNLLPNLGIPNGAQLFNPTYFQDLTITGYNTGSLFSIDSGSQPSVHNGSMNFTAYNVIFQTNVAATKPLIHTNGGVMDFYGGCRLVSSNNSAFIISNTATQPVIMNLHDNTIVDGYTLFFSGGTVSLTINVGPQATYGTIQQGVSISVTVNGGNLVGAWSTAANGTILTKTGAATADWLSAPVSSNQLIYQPGGSNSGATYTSWAALMTQRATIPGLVDILIDDSFAVGGAYIDVGSWDLQNTTRLFGRKGTQNANTNSSGLTKLNLPGGAYLNNPYEFRDLLITGSSTSASTLVSFPSSGANLPQATINVNSTTGFPTSGTFRVATSVGISTVTYTGVTSNTFTGCSGGTGQLSSGGVVNQYGPNIDFSGINLNVAVSFYNCYLTTITASKTAIAGGSNLAVLPQSTINVSSAVGFPSLGTVLVQSSAGVQAINYTGTTNSTFTGCTGGTGTLTSGTTIAVGSNGANLPQSTINVASTTNFPTSGTFLVVSNGTFGGTYTITYTGTTGTSFTGCTGGAGTLATGNAVTSPVTDLVGTLLHIGSNTFFANNTNVNLYENTTVVSPAAITTTFAGITGYPLPPTGGNLQVGSTAGFPSSGSVLITNNANTLQLITYTGVTGNVFTGCTGGSGSLVFGSQVYSPNPVFHNASITNTYINLYDASNLGAGTVQFATATGVNSVVLHTNVNSPAAICSYLQPFITGNNYQLNITALSQAFYSNVVMIALGNVTLTPSQYNASTIAVTSQLSLGITYNIVMPLIAGRSWVVANQTQFGGQSLQFIGISGTGFTVANGSSALIWSDGVNIYGLSAGSSGITALTGDVTASGSGSVTATVTRINGTTVPAGGALTTGNQLIVNGVSSATWSSLNLAGGAGFVTGNLPVTNIASGSSAQFLMTSSGLVTTWTTISGDISVTSGGAVAVTKIQGNAVSVTAATAGQFLIENVSANGSAWTSLSGDVTNSVVAPGGITVVKVNGITISGAVVAGNQPIATSSSAASWGALNLAGGAGFITGNLPLSNLTTGTSGQVLMSNATPTNTWTTLTGDVTISATGVTTASKINGTSVPAAPTNNQVLVATSGTTATWTTIADANITAGGINNVSIGAAAAIAGTKVNPAFGSQNISTSGTLASGTHTITGALAWATGSAPSYGFVNVTMASDANLTLTNVQYNSGEISIASSVSLTATRNIVMPLTAGGEWVIYNHTTGGQSLQIIGASGTGFTITNGTSAVIWTDGTNFYGTGSSFTAGLDLSGSSSSQTVIGIRGNSVPAPSGSSTLLFWNGASFSWQQANANNIVNPQVQWSPVDLLQTGSTAVIATVNTTTGIGFTVQAQLTITGTRFYWAGSSAVTLKTTLWTSGGTRLATGTLAISAPGVYTIPFTSAYTMLAADKDALLYLSVWDTSGATYTRTTQASITNLPAFPFIAGPYFTVTSIKSFATNAGNDAVPSSLAGTEFYPVEPIFSGITGVGVHTPNVTTTYTVTAKDQYIPVSTSGGPFTITAPLLPVLGQQFIIADVGGTFSANNLTITGNGNNILTPTGSATTVVLSTNWDQTVFTYNGVTWSMTLNGSFTAAGDLTGSQSSQTVVALRGKSLASALSTIGAGQDGFVLSWVNANNDWEAKVAPSGSFSAGGDLAGTAGSQQVTGITGAAGAVSITAAIQGSTGGSGTPLHESAVTIAMTDANYTLSASDMAKPIIEFTGTLTANRSILCPTTNGAKFTISNKTTGGFILTVHRADGADAGVTVYNGQNANVFYDGVLDNSYEATSVNGTVAVQAGGSPIKSLHIYGFAGVNQTNSGTFVNGATFEFDPTTLNAANGTRTIKLRVIAETTAPLMTIQLFNFTATTVVTGSTLTTSSTSPATLVTGDLTANLSNSLAIYQVQIKMAAGTGTDRITLDAAKLQIDWS